MKIIADENIPFVREVFQSLGEVVSVPGREMNAAIVAEADVLLVRSVTRVNADLVAESRVRFVGTATIGTDHIDEAYLAEAGICFVSAAGSNSNSVAEYVLAALLVLAEEQGWHLAEKTLGIIGVGNIGSKVEKKAKGLGVRVLLNDPPLERQTSDSKYVSLETILQEADIITCHVPLTRTGPDATWHLFDQAMLERLRPGTILINSARGAVVDNETLKHRLRQGDLGAVVLDVWENEPKIDKALLKQVALGTPHIAGYSFDGKVNGTLMLYEALCKYLKKPVEMKIESLLPKPPIMEMVLNIEDRTEQAILCDAMQRIYDIRGDDRRLRQMLDQTSAERGVFFDRLRKTYPVRREAFNTRVRLSRPDEGLAIKLRHLGFQV